MEKTRERYGFRSASALIAFMIEPLAKDHFTELSFERLAKKFGKMAGEHPTGKLHWKQLNPLHKISISDPDTVSREQQEAAENERTGNLSKSTEFPT